MSGKILVVIETDKGKVRESGFETIEMARRLAADGGTVCAAVLGEDPKAPADEVARRGAETVYAVADAVLSHYTADGYCAALQALMAQQEIETVLFAHTPLGWDVAPKLAARHGVPALMEVTGAEGNVWTRGMFNGKLQVKMRFESSPVVATVQKGALPAFEGETSGTVESFAPGLEAGTIRQKFVEVQAAPARQVDLASADVIVSGGRSLGGPEKFEIIKELATALGGQVGASRPVTDSGWLPHEHQVGSSGVTVKPKLYIAAGISGAIQHIAGMKQSGYIIAINKDKEAPIFDIADVGIVGDLFEVVPALTKAVQEAKAKG